MFKIVAFFIITLLPGYIWGFVFYALKNTFKNNRIISQREKVWTIKSTLSSPLFMEVSVPGQENGWSDICVLEYRFYIFLLSTIFLLDFETVPTVGYCWYPTNWT